MRQLDLSAVAKQLTDMAKNKVCFWITANKPIAAKAALREPLHAAETAAGTSEQAQCPVEAAIRLVRYVAVMACAKTRLQCTQALEGALGMYAGDQVHCEP
jgi:hypothetical protein